MLGVQRVWACEGDANVARHDQVAHIEEMWDLCKDERKGRKQPRKPADGLSYTIEYGNIIEPSEDDAEI